jgi:pteridine reductase
MAHESIVGKTALVTGAGLRLGRAIARELARNGANLVLHYRDSETEAAALQAELQGLGVRAWTVRADFSVREEYETLLARATAAAGEIDFLVNSASIFPPSTLQDLSFADLSATQLVNAWAPFYLTRELAGRGGPRKVVNLLDSRLTSDDPTHVAYLLSKHLLSELTRRCALAYAPEVAVNSIAPGLILPPPGKDMSYLEGLTSSVPLKRHGDEQDIAQAVLYLLTSTFLTGTVLYVDGGRHLIEYKSGPASSR